MKRIDPRYLQILALLFYSIVAREVYHVERSHVATLLCVITCIVSDLAFGYGYFRVLRFPISSIIIGLALSLLIDSKTLWIYPVAALISIASKAFFSADGRHIFNPANFGLIAVLTLFPGLGIPKVDLFSGSFEISLIFLALGSVVSGYSGSLSTSALWTLFFILFALLRCLWAHGSLILFLGPALTPTFLLFTFHMITCPATSPRGFRNRVIYTFAIALIDAVFRFKEIPYGQFYAQFGACALVPLLRTPGEPSPWQRFAPRAAS